jgi:hypothetical protein
MASTLLSWAPDQHQARAKTHRDLRAGLGAQRLAYIRSEIGQDRQFIKNRRLRTRFEEDWPSTRGEPEYQQVTNITPLPRLTPRRARRPRSK